MQAELGRKMLAEAMGAFALTFIGVGSIIYGAAGGGLTTVALAHGFVIAAMVCAVGHISGGHFNPAVTFGFLVTRRISLPDAVGYWAAQLGAAVLAALALKLTLPSGVTDIDGGATVLADGVSVASGFAIEFILTFFLMWVIFAVAVDPRGSFAAVAGIPIGMVITFDIMAGGPLTGASMNPSRSFGPALVGGVWDNLWIYFVACPLGAAAAALLYHRVILAGRE
ncbi:MAG: aquaporin [Gaiellales bacterium]|jgi:aquaporin Z|nr:aquaporin [Gaiellales bacterium]